MSAKLEAIEQELAKIATRHKKRADEAAKDRGRESELREKRALLRLEPLVGVVGGVALQCRGFDKRIPDNAVGTLVEIRRTRCTVDFGEHGRWTLGGYDVRDASTEQAGFVLRFGGGS